MKATIKLIHVSTLHCVINDKQTIIDKIGRTGTQGVLNSPSFGSPKSLRSLITPKASKIRYASVTILTNKARISKGKIPEKSIVTKPQQKQYYQPKGIQCCEVQKEQRLQYST